MFCFGQLFINIIELTKILGFYDNYWNSNVCVEQNFGIFKFSTGQKFILKYCTF